VANNNNPIDRTFRVRFAQIDSAQVIYYPRYLEMVADTFPEAQMGAPPFDLSIRFMKPNRLGDDVRMRLTRQSAGWSVSGHMTDEHFLISLVAADKQKLLAHEDAYSSSAITVRNWMCGPSGRLHVSRYFELISHAIEQWFESSLSLTFYELHVRRGLGIPTVQLDTQCQGLPAAGDEIVMRLHPLSVGSSALQLQSWLVCTERVLLTSRQVIVFVKKSDNAIETVRIPGELREQIQRQIES